MAGNAAAPVAQGKETAMIARKLIRTASIAAAAVVVSTAAALAFVPFNVDAIKNSDVYANRNQQTAHVVNHIEKGQTVKVMQIKPYWCFIQIPGEDGWVKCAVLEPFI
jgi:hypothetical protein